MKRLAVLLTALAVMAGVPGAFAADPLSSWRNVRPRQRILAFVTEVTTPANPTFVAPANRIAIFDDDGTLWPEKPRAQGMFALQRLRTLAPGHPEWQQQLPYAAALRLGSKYLEEATDEDVLRLLTTAHAGRTAEDFRADVRGFFATARHPRFNQPYTRLVYAPMRELISHLKARGFRVFIRTTGSVELVRVLSEELYGVRPDQVVGSVVPGEQKPILAVGNVRSGGDIEMLRSSQQPSVRTLQVLLQHDDFEREYAYEEPDGASLKAASANGWLLVSMRFDWLRVFNAP